VRDQVQVVRARGKVARVERHAKAAVGKLAAERGGAGVAEAQLRILQLACVGRDVQPHLDTTDAAALDALVQVGTRVQRIAHDEKIAVGVQLLVSFGRHDADDQ